MSFFDRLFGSRGAEPETASPLASQFPFPVEAVAGKDAVAELERLRVVGAAEGFTPVILGDERELGFLLERLMETEEEETTESILAAAEAVDFDAWLAEQEAVDAEYHEMDFSEPGEGDRVGLIAHLDPLTGAPKPRIYLGRIPTPRAWEVAAHLKYGGWNECPTPEVQVAASRRWHERYGATVAAMTSDVVQYTVARPPAGRASAEALAREQFLFCTDIVHQGVETVANLAASLQDSPAWYFWWD